MAKGTTVKELRDKSESELSDLTKSTKNELFTARFENHTNKLNDTAKIRKLRRQLARIHTVKNQRHVAAPKSEG